MQNEKRERIFVAPVSDAELFALLDLNLNGLGKTRAAVDVGDLDVAKAELAAYLRNRPTNWVTDSHPSNTPSDTTNADRVVAGEIVQITILHTFPGSDIDWFCNPTREQDDLPVNNEWQWQLNRMGFWRALGRAYRETKDERYAQTFVTHLRRWAAQCPRPDDHGNYPQSAWRTIESGIRMSGSWPYAFHAFLHSPSFTDGDLVLYLKLCIEHARHLRAHHRPSGNWLTMEMAGLYTIGAVFPEFKAAKAWRRYAIDLCYRELETQFTPDGAQIELTTGYHWHALRNILTVPLLAAQMGLADELPADFLMRSEKGFEFTLYMMTPDGSTPRVNDAQDEQDVSGMMQMAVTLFPDRADFVWAASGREKGRPPEEVSHAFPYAGYYVMRSGWETDATMACFDAGPTGIAHDHQDKLNLMLWAYGREALLDNGGGPYEQSKWRRYGINTHSHNTVLVDGLSQHRERGYAAEPLEDVIWQSTDAFDYVQGIYAESYGETMPATHHRRVLFVKPDLFLVADTLVPIDDGAHTYQARWHYTTPGVALDPRTQTVVSCDAGLPNLAVAPLLTDGLDVRTISAQEQPELLGWWVRKWAVPKAVPTATVLHTRMGKGTQHFLTLLLPLRTGEGNPVRQVRHTTKGMVEVTLTDGRWLQCSASPDPAGALRVTETLPTGETERHVHAQA